MDKNGNWDFNLASNPKEDIFIDQKTLKHVIGDIKTEHPEMFKKHKPVIEGTMNNKQKIVPKKGTTVDSDLLSTMALRLTKLEQISEVQRKELKEKAEKLEKANQELEVLQSICGQDQMKTIKELKDSNLRLEKENIEMKDFLRDYGLIWVGKDGKTNKNFDVNAVKENLNQKGSLFRNNLPSEIDLEVIAKRIEELNFIAEKDAVQVVNKEGVHVLKKPDAIPFGFFKDGLIIKGYPFRAYHSKEGQGILSDLLDGYFPHEIKAKYPEGIPFKIIDHTDESFTNIKKQSNIFELANQDNDFSQPTTKQFLEKFPDKIISKEGDIIPIKEEIAKRIEKIDKKVNEALNHSGEFKIKKLYLIQ